MKQKLLNGDENQCVSSYNDFLNFLCFLIPVDDANISQAQAFTGTNCFCCSVEAPRNKPVTHLKYI